MRFIALAAALLIMTQTASAHEASGIAGGFSSGFMHPILGWDHVAAMVAVGLWGAVLRQPAIWILPVTFPLVMAIGGALGVAGIPLPGVEIGIASSALILGMLVLAAARPPLWLAAVVVASFAIFHGHAHGTELPHAVSPLAYSLGFVLSTGMLHLCGIAFGLLTRWRAGTLAVRAGGAVIALAGALFLARAI
ncbi:HupE/UreJ family protein [Halieaceae bacterium]|nr:HupE/UreJ family protein [Halieaceae bacterium]